MKVVIQRVQKASVSVASKKISSIQQGLVIYLGVTHTDSEKEVDFLIQKITSLRIFSDTNDKMNLSILETKGQVLVVSQFTLYGNLQKGNRPSFINAAKPDLAKKLYDSFLTKLAIKIGLEKVQAGQFGANMQVMQVVDGPVTFDIEI